MEAEQKLSWDDVVVVKDTTRSQMDPGFFALMRTSDWCNYGDKVVVWRGPEKRDEIVKTVDFQEVSCTTVLVDDHGFYTCKPTEKPRFYRCPEITEDLKDAIEKASEKALEPYADDHAAESYTEIEWQQVSERLGDEVFTVAKFGDTVAVNGQIVGSRKKAKPPRGWKKIQEGRYEGMEAEIDVGSLVDQVTHEASKELEVRIDPRTVHRILRQIYPSGYAYWSSGYGDVEVWVSKELFKRHEELEEQRLHREAEKERIKAAVEMQAAEERRERERQEYRRRVREGGYPGPRDWSPRGELP